MVCSSRNSATNARPQPAPSWTSWMPSRTATRNQKRPHRVRPHAGSRRRADTDPREAECVGHHAARTNGGIPNSASRMRSGKSPQHQLAQEPHCGLARSLPRTLQYKSSLTTSTELYVLCAKLVRSSMPVDRSRLILALRRMDALGVGRFLLGRRGKATRFEWHEKSLTVRKLATD